MPQIFISEKVRAIRPSKIREALAKVEDSLKKGIEITNFSIGRPDFDTPLHIKEAAKKALDRGAVHYATSQGLMDLREAICQRCQREYGIKVKPDQVIVTIGATEAIYTGLQCILEPGDEVLVPAPMYVSYEGLVILSGAKCIPIPLSEKDDFQLKESDVKKYLSEKTKALIITSPHNPTGQVYEKEELIKIAKLAIQKEFIVVSDDIYNKMIYDNVEYFHIAQVPGMDRWTLMVDSMSKTYAMDGWRIGYLIGPPDIISGAAVLHQHHVSCANTFVQIAAQAALNGSQDSVNEMVAELDRRRRFMISCLDEIGFSYTRPRGAFYIFPSIKKFGLDLNDFMDFLLKEARVSVVPGDAFGPEGKDYFRMAYTVPYEEIEKGMERMHKAIRRL